MTTSSKQMIERKKSVMDYLIKKNKPAMIYELMNINNYTRTQIQNTMRSLSNENKVARINKKEKRISYIIKKNRIDALMMFYDMTMVRCLVW